MNVLLAHFQIQDWGGILNYSEFMARGLKDLGHTVGSVMLKNKGKTGQGNPKDRSQQPGWEHGPGLDLWYHQKGGWEGMYQLNYAADMQSWEDLVEDYDLVVYVVPVPTCSKSTKDDIQWLKLFDFPLGKQLAVVHDGNMQSLYPHILRICDKIDGVVCVHDAAYNSCATLPIRRILLPNPHEFDKTTDIPAMQARDDGFIALQTFKRWKHVDDLIRAMPYMDEFTEKVICGGGIEYHYMTSPNKVKDCYLEADGSRIWENALAAGMDYRGYITTAKRDLYLKRLKLLVDPSWSLKYSQLGAHFNRVMVEAMAHGCVPVCTDLGMRNSSFFKAGVNYIEIPYNTSPEQYADIIDRSLVDLELLERIQAENLELVKEFDKCKVAAELIDFAQSSYGKIGSVTEKFEKDSDRKMLHFDEFA